MALSTADQLKLVSALENINCTIHMQLYACTTHALKTFTDIHMCRLPTKHTNSIALARHRATSMWIHLFAPLLPRGYIPPKY